MTLPTTIFDFQGQANDIDYAQLGGYGTDILSDATINTATGQDTRIFQIYGCRQVDVLISSGPITAGGTLTVTLNAVLVNTANVAAPTPVKIIASYAGSGISSAGGGVDSISVSVATGTGQVLGDYVFVSWALSGGGSASNVFIRLVPKK